MQNLPHTAVGRRAALVGAGLTLALALGAGAQEPARPDSLKSRRDSAVVLPEITVTRQPEPIDKVPAAVGVITKDAVRRGQQTIGLDEALNNIPGVYVANRYNFSVDQRISIRGAGSRANFGLRGVKVLLDGIPQTLPDGQSQLSNIDFAVIERVEVLRGAASSLYGNASGGVLSFFTELPPAESFAQVFRVHGGSWGSYKWQSRTAARTGRLAGMLSISRFKTDGFRQQAAADIRNLNAAADLAVGGSSVIGVRLLLDDTPRAQNPGALTPAEYAAKFDSAAPTNILRGADKDVQQQQLGLTFRTHDAKGNSLDATVFGLLRQLKNPLATPPRGGLPATSRLGTFVDIDRQVGGARLATTLRAGPSERAPRVTAGVDWQVLRDRRKNFLAIGGVAQDSTLVDQRENVSELGPFAQVTWSPVPNLLLAGGGRYDRVSFDVKDFHFGDGVDNSGDRTMSAWSGNVGASYTVGEAFTPYANVSTAFETPTTTELANRVDGSGGFNPDLGPQRTLNYEVGARGRTGVLHYSVALFRSRITDAIVQFTADAGRSYFANAGRIRNQGIELGIDVRPIRQLGIFVSATHANYKFTDYKVRRSPTTVDTLDGKRLPAVPQYFVRLGLRATPIADLHVDADHTVASEIFADDRNTQRIGGGPGEIAPGYGAGVTNLRVNWEGQVGQWRVAPFVGINNLWDRRYVASVTINGAFARVLEPSPRRNVYVGTELGWKTRR
ncbi:MAG: TonB-dependent receptor family protein [Gemmatimonadota bacterium]